MLSSCCDIRNMLDIDPAFEGHELEKVDRHKAMKHGACTLFTR